MIVPFGERGLLPARPTIADPRPGRARRRHRSRRLLRPAPAHGAAEAALGQPLARDRPRVRIARQHALALRRAGLHGVGDAGREEHAGRLAESLPAGRARCATTPLTAVAMARQMPRALRAARRRWRWAASASSACAAAWTHATRSKRRTPAARIRCSTAPPAKRSRRCGRCRSRHPAPYRPANGADVSALAVRPGAAGDRAARQGGRRPRDRVRREQSVGPPRQRRRRDRADRQSPRRLRARHRGARARPRRSDGRHGHPDDVGVRPNGRGERQSRHRSRPRQRDDADRRRRQRRQGLRRVAGLATSSATKARPGGHHRLPRRVRRGRDAPPRRERDDRGARVPRLRRQAPSVQTVRARAGTYGASRARTSATTFSSSAVDAFWLALAD